MATTQTSSGGHSPKSFSGSIEKVFDEARHTGIINLTNRKLKEFPKYGKKYDLRDTTGVDISKNRFTDIPGEVCSLPNLEHLHCYGNVLKCIPEAIVQLQSLVRCNLSRNQLTYIPEFICQLKNLEVLLASNNKLVSLPEEIGQLHKLMDLDISCNEITHLPNQMGELDSLRSLNVRSNLLVELPTELCQLKLRRLDMSDNRISRLPHEYRHLETLEDIQLQNNPLVSPPAQVCQKGRVHIMKYLEKEARKEDRKRGVLNEFDIKPNSRLSGLPQSLSEEFSSLEPLSERVIKRRTVDSGYSTTDSLDKSRFSPSEYTYHPPVEAYPTDSGYEMFTTSPVGASGTLSRAFRRLGSSLDVSSDSHMDIPHQVSAAEVTPTTTTVATAAVPPPGGHRVDHYQPKSYGREPQHQHHQPEVVQPPQPPSQHQHLSLTSPRGFVSSPLGASIADRPTTLPAITSPSQPAPPRPNLISSIGGGGVATKIDSQFAAETTTKAEDEFTRELQKQKSEYEAKKRRAEQMKLDLENRDQQQEHTNGMMSPVFIGAQSPDKEREETRRAAIKLQEEQKALMDRHREMHSGNRRQEARKVSHSGSFKGEDKATCEASPYTNRYFRRTVSEASYAYNQGQQPSTTSAETSQLPADNPRPAKVRSPQYTVTNPDKMRNQTDYGNQPLTPTTPVTPTNQDGDQYDRLPSPWNNNSESPNSPLTPKTPTPDGKRYIVAPTTTTPAIDNGVHSIPVQHYQQSSQQPPQQQSAPVGLGDSSYGNSTSPTSEAGQHSQPLEFRRRHEALLHQQRQEAQLARRRLEEEKQRLKLRQKDAVMNFVTQRQVGHNDSSSDSSTFSFSRDSTPNTSFDATNLSTANDKTELPKYQKALDKLEAMSSELNSMKPGFTVRRQLDQYSREGDQIEQLRQIVESRLKVKLPDDLPSALRDGVVLCHLANHIRPRSISSIHVPSQAMPKLSMAKCRRNVENFLEACRQIGVKDEYVCTANSVLEQNGLAYLNITVQCLLNCASKVKPQQSTV